MSGLLWLGPALAPLAALLGLAWPPARAAALRVAPWTAMPALLTALLAPPGAADLPWLLLGARVGLDGTGRAFLGVTALVWLGAGIFGERRRDGAPATRFYAFYLATMSGNLGLVLALDAATFQLGYALMGFAAYGIVAHQRTAAAFRAARLYLGLVVIGEVMVFAGAVLLYRSAGSALLAELAAIAPAAPARDAAFLLLLGGFAIKSAVVPLHVWLPPAYGVAPVPGSAVLGGAMINAGLLGWLRFLPLGSAVAPVMGPLCIVVGFGSAFYGTIIGLFQHQSRTALAYSSVSQMGLVTVGLGAALMAPETWPAVQPALLLYATHHGLSKGALFLGAGVAAAARGALQRAVAAAGLLIPALALAGAPGTSGAVAKEGLKHATHALPALWGDTIGGLLPLVAVGTTLVMARALALIWSANGAGPEQVDAGRWSGWLVLVAAIGTAIWWLPSLAGWSGAGWSLPAVLGAAWPVAAGSLLALLVVWARKAGWVTRWPAIPAGDVWVPIERSAVSLGRRLRAGRRPGEREPATGSR